MKPAYCIIRNDCGRDLYQVEYLNEGIGIWHHSYKPQIFADLSNYPDLPVLDLTSFDSDKTLSFLLENDQPIECNPYAGGKPLSEYLSIAEQAGAKVYTLGEFLEMAKPCDQL